jgi:protein-S-isoprenylcysteine O-methyltransferase Ste14
VKATQFEFRFRLWISFAMFVLGFWAPWLHYGHFAGTMTSSWLELSGELARCLPIETASVAVTCVIILLAILGAGFRVWGTAYMGSAVVKSGEMHAHGVVAAGPYRYLRNPLYLGSYLFALATAILMPPSGAIFVIVANFVQILRLILREEAYLESQQGEAYLAYKSRVPRLFPSLLARVPASRATPQWRQAVIAEIFYVTMTGCFAVLAWRYNAMLLLQALLVCFGLSLVARAFVKKQS